MLILTGEVVFTDRSTDAVEGVERLATGMQGLALTAGKASRFQDRLDLVSFICLGNRRKAQNLPGLLPKDVADEVVFVKPLHNDDNGTVPLVV